MADEPKDHLSPLRRSQLDGYATKPPIFAKLSEKISSQSSPLANQAIGHVVQQMPAYKPRKKRDAILNGDEGATA